MSTNLDFAQLTQLRKKRRSVSPIQKKLMLQYLRRNPELISAKFSTSFSVKDAQSKWSEMSRMLNRLPGSRKDWKHWRKTWHDIRSKTKAKHQQGLFSTFTQTEKQVLRLIGELNSTTENNTENNETDVKPDNNEYESDGELFVSNFLPINKSEPLHFGKNQHNIIFELDAAEEPVLEDPLMMLRDSRNLERPDTPVDDDISLFRGVGKRTQSKPKQTYHELKLRVLQRIAAAKEKSAAAKERIAAALEKIAASGTAFV